MHLNNLVTRNELGNSENKISIRPTTKEQPHQSEGANRIKNGEKGERNKENTWSKRSRGYCYIARDVIRKKLRDILLGVYIVASIVFGR
jgi:hypothetical protein